MTVINFNNAEKIFFRGKEIVKAYFQDKAIFGGGWKKVAEGEVFYDERKFILIKIETNSIIKFVAKFNDSDDVIFFADTKNGSFHVEENENVVKRSGFYVVNGRYFRFGYRYSFSNLAVSSYNRKVDTLEIYVKE